MKMLTMPIYIATFPQDFSWEHNFQQGALNITYAESIYSVF